MHSIAILQSELNELPDWTEAYPKEAKVGTKYKVRSIHRGQILWSIGEVTHRGGILKHAVIVDEYYEKV